MQLLDVLMDLLAYHQSGSLKNLNRLCEQAIEFVTWHGCEDDKTALVKLLQKRLQDFGFIEFANEAGVGTWCCIEAGFIEIAQDEYLIVGPLHFREQVIAAMKPLVSVEQLSSHQLYTFPKKFDFEHALMLTKVNITRDSINKLSNDLQVNIYQQSERSFTLLLTPLELACNELLVDEYFTGITEYTQFERFDFQRCQWETVDASEISTQGYYRLPYQFGAPRHVCLTKALEINRLYDIPEVDWAYFIALKLFNQKALWKYVVNEQQLWIPTKHFVLLPNLFKRALICQAFIWPQIQDNHYVITNISVNDTALILQRYPILRVNYEL